MPGLFGALVLRWATFLALALRNHRRQRRREADLPPVDDTLVSVIVPAWQEARVVASTVRSLARSTWPSLEILVVDDGSTDGTADAAEALRAEVPGLRVLRQPHNAGKPAALNAGLAAANGAIVVTVDADTLCDPRAVERLVRTMRRTGAAAVASNVKVGNRAGLLGRWQSLEYVTGLNIDRRAQRELGIVTTVPGAAAAWARGPLEQVGGFPDGTLAEDTDLTLSLLRRGHIVEYDDRAVAFTEAPVTLGALFRQRTRWLYGNLQCAARHTRGPAPWRFRLLALPNLWFAHLGIYLLPPVALLWLVASGGPAPGLVGGLLGALLAVDLTTALVAYALDRDDPRDLVHVVPQRIGYPLFLWAVFAGVVGRLALRVPTGWGRQVRTGTVRLTDDAPPRRVSRR